MEYISTCLQSLVELTTNTRSNWLQFFYIAVDCGPLTIANGAVDTSSGTTFMMTATYTCNTGYTLIGANTRTCGGDGQWTPDAPTCLRTQVISNINCMFTISSL